MTKVLTLKERKVITSLYKLNRYSNSNEVSKLAGVSWYMSNNILKSLYNNECILSRKIINGIIHYKLKV